MNDKSRKRTLQYSRRCQPKLVRLPSTTTTTTAVHKAQFVKSASKDVSLSQGLGRTQNHNNNYRSDNRCNSASSSNSNNNNNSTTSQASIANHSLKSSLKNMIKPNYDDKKIHINNNNNKCEFTEQRYNYECLRPQIATKFNSNCDTERSLTYADHLQTHMDSYDDLIDGKFYSLQEFRLKNVHDCFGEQRQREILYQQLMQQRQQQTQKQEYITLSSTNDNDNYCISQPYEWTVNAKQKKNYENFNKTIPYQLRQRQLREELSKEYDNNKLRSTKARHLALNPSLALSYQPMY